MRHAAVNVPFYRDLYRSASVKPDDIRTLEDLNRLPVVTKAQLRDAGDAVIAEGIDRRHCREIHTAGSTGIPFRVLVSHAESRIRSLVHFRCLRKAGFSWPDRLVVAGPEETRKARFHERLGLYRTEVIPAGLAAEEQIRLLKAARPTILWTYPHALQELQYILQGRLSRIIHPRMLIVSGAVLHEAARQRARADLGCDEFNFYGCMEVGRLAAECPAHRGLHVNADHVILECLADDHPAGPGERGVTVITGLNAFTMPFIRFRLGDYCSPLAADHACSCGSSFPLISAPEGRADDVFRLPSGKMVTSLQFLYAIRRFPDVDQFRFIQERRDRILIEIATRTPWPGERVESLRALILERIGEPMDLEVRFVEFLRADGVKLQAFVCRTQDGGG